MADRAEALFEGPDFTDALHELAYYDMNTVLGMPSFRLSLVAMAEAEGDEVIRDAIAHVYHGPLDVWREVYKGVLGARGLRLREGLTIDEITDILAAMEDGMSMRSVGDPEAQVINHEKRRTLLGKAILAMMAGCVVRVEDTSSMTVEEAVRDLIYKRHQK